MSYHYSDVVDLVTATDQLGHQQKYRFRDHLIQKLTLKSGFSFYFEWSHVGPDARCLRNWGDNINGQPTYDYRFTWDLANNTSATSTTTDTRGGTTTYRFNDHGLPVWIQNPEGDETHYEYDRDGNLIKSTDAN